MSHRDDIDLEPHDNVERAAWDLQRAANSLDPFPDERVKSSLDWQDFNVDQVHGCIHSSPAMEDARREVVKALDALDDAKANYAEAMRRARTRLLEAHTQRGR